METKITGILPALLTVLFVYLKLTNQIDWPWIWVVSPLWIPLAMVVGFIMAIIAVYLITIIISMIVYGCSRDGF